MIKVIEAAQIVTYLARRSGNDFYECEYSTLRRIGSYIEKHDSSIRVEIGERYYRSFRSRSVRHIIIGGNSLIIEGVNNPIMQAIIKQYAVSGRIAALIEEAINDGR